MVAIPAAVPVTTPVALIVATAVLLLLQLPPVLPSPKSLDDPVHKLPSPVMAAGSGLITTGKVTKQPPESL